MFFDSQLWPARKSCSFRRETMVFDKLLKVCIPSFMDLLTKHSCQHKCRNACERVYELICFICDIYSKCIWHITLIHFPHDDQSRISHGVPRSVLGSLLELFWGCWDNVKSLKYRRFLLLFRNMGSPGGHEGELRGAGGWPGEPFGAFGVFWGALGSLLMPLRC